MKTNKSENPQDTVKESIMDYGTETISRLNTETSPYFKPFKYIGGIMIVASGAIVALSGKLLTIGGLLFGGAALTKKEGSVKEGKNTLWGTIKNVILK
jgi:hypothetical protein